MSSHATDLAVYAKSSSSLLHVGPYVTLHSWCLSVSVECGKTDRMLSLYNVRSAVHSISNCCFMAMTHSPEIGVESLSVVAIRPHGVLYLAVISVSSKRNL